MHLRTTLSRNLLLSGVILSICAGSYAQSGKQQSQSIDSNKLMYVFDAKELKFKTEIIGARGSRQLELTVDFTQVSKLYELQRVTALVEFFQAGKSLGKENFELATGTMQSVKDRKKIKHAFALSPKYQGIGVISKGIQISAPAVPDTRYVNQQPTVLHPVV